MKEIVKEMAFKITQVTGTTGNSIKETKCDVDESYDEISEVLAFENSTGGVANGYYQIGISDSDRSYLDLVHKNSLLTSVNVGQDQKGKRLPIPIRKGMGLKVRTFWPTAGALASDLEYEVVFRLVKRVVEK